MLLAALALPASARAQAPAPYYDARAVAPEAQPRAATRALERRLGPQAVVDVDPITRTPRVLARLDGTLSGPAAGAAAPIALRYVRANLAALGLTEADLGTLGEPTVESGGGVRQVRWRQSVDGVEAADSELRVTVTRDGRVLNVLGAPSSDLPTDTTPALDRAAAIRAVRADLGGSGNATAKLTLYVERLAWRVTYHAAPDAIYDVMVDAESGDILRRANMVRSASGLVWDNHPGAQHGGTARSVVLDPWLTSATKLDGTWVHTYSDTDSGDDADPSEEVVPREIAFQSAPFASGPGCGTLPCSWSGSGTSWQTNREQNAVQAFYLANLFRDHLASAPIGFDGFSGADRVLLETTDTGGASTNNANMYTPPEGESPRMQMYLWRSPYRNMNSGDDASILFHEYAHGLTGRLVTDADGVGALNSWQAGAMGEGWSDFYAKDFLVERFPGLDTATPGDVHMGVYAEVTANSMRNQGLDCPVGVTAQKCPGGGFTYEDFAAIENGPQYHSDGEIWAQTLWDLRTALGVETTRRIVTQALDMFTPAEPSFLDARNAILQADVAAHAGANRTAIWNVFRARGMGFYASTVDGADIHPVHDDSPPPAAGGPRGTLAGVVTDAVTGAPLPGVTVSIGGLTSGPDALKATSGPDGRYAIANIPARTYRTVVARAEGYDEQRITDVPVPAGGAVTRDIATKRNWATDAELISKTVGAENAGMGCGPAAAIDGLLASTWSTTRLGTKPLVVKLTKNLDVTGFAVDPGAGCGDNANAGTQGFRIETSKTGAAADWQVAATGTFAITDQHRLNPVGGTAVDIAYVRLTPLSNHGAGWIDVSEFAVYGREHLLPPETTITAGPQGVESDTTPEFEFRSDMPGTFECRLGSGAWAACTSPHPLGPLVNGQSYTFEVRALNLNGQPDATPASRSFTINTSFPTTQLLTAPAAFVKERTATFTFSGTGTGLECSWDGGSLDPCNTGTSTRDNLAEGPHTFSVRAINGAGADPSPATHAFTVDSIAPELTLEAPEVEDDSARFVFSGADATALTYRCTFRGVTEPCTSPKVYTGLPDGSHELTVVARDAAGNETTGSQTAQILVEPYDTELYSWPDELITVRNVEFEFDSPDGGSAFECSLDGGAYAPCTSPHARSGLADGPHTFAVRAAGPGSRVDLTPAAHAFTIDATPPETILTWAPPAILTSRDVSFAFTANEAASFECEVDGVPSTCTSPLVLTGLADGAHSVTVTAVDVAGNMDPTPERRIFSVALPNPSPPGPGPTPTPTVAPAPKRKALESVRVAKSASLKTLRRQGRIRFTLRAPDGAKIAVRAKLGSRVIGKTNRTARAGGATIQLSLDKKQLRKAKAGKTLTLRVSGTGTGLTAASQTLRVKLRL